MLDLYLWLWGLYLFTLWWFLIKRNYKEKIDKKTLTLILVYFFQPILGFWWFVKAPLDLSILYAWLFYFFVVFFVMIILFFITKIFVKDKKLRIISTITWTIWNTWNMWIPLSWIIFWPVWIVIATMINFFNVLWVFIFWVYFYSRWKFDIKNSILEIVKMPIIWASLAGVFINIFWITFPKNLMAVLDMWAYTSIAMQLFLLWIFIEWIKIKLFDWKLNLYIVIIKFLFLPFIWFLLLYFYKNNFWEINNVIYWVILLELFTPLAVNNANLAHLYDCYERKVSETILTTYIIFLVLFPILMNMIL